MVCHKLKQTNKNKQTSQKKKKKSVCSGPSEAVEARRSNRKAVWTEWMEAKPGHGARGVGGGADGFIIGGGGDPLMSIHGIKDNGGAAEQGPCRRKREKKK